MGFDDREEPRLVDFATGTGLGGFGIVAMKADGGQIEIEAAQQAGDRPGGEIDNLAAATGPGIFRIVIAEHFETDAGSVEALGVNAAMRDR